MVWGGFLFFSFFFFRQILFLSKKYRQIITNIFCSSLIREIIAEIAHIWVSKKGLNPEPLDLKSDLLTVRENWYGFFKRKEYQDMAFVDS